MKEKRWNIVKEKSNLKASNFKSNLKSFKFKATIIMLLMLTIAIITGSTVMQNGGSPLNKALEKMVSSEAKQENQAEQASQAKQENQEEQPSEASTLEKIQGKANNEIATIAETPDNWNAKSARVYLNWKTGSFGGITQKNYLHVYAFEGDTICFGSNVYNAGYNLEGTSKTNSTNKDEESVDVVLYDLDNKATPFDITLDGKGHISNLEKEKAAKNLTSPEGDSTYVPLTYMVKETGVYTIEFRTMR